MFLSADRRMNELPTVSLSLWSHVSPPRCPLSPPHPFFCQPFPLSPSCSYRNCCHSWKNVFNSSIISFNSSLCVSQELWNISINHFRVGRRRFWCLGGAVHFDFIQKLLQPRSELLLQPGAVCLIISSPDVSAQQIPLKIILKLFG